jgi:hypothetical protein
MEGVNVRGSNVKIRNARKKRSRESNLYSRRCLKTQTQELELNPKRFTYNTFHTFLFF